MDTDVAYRPQPQHWPHSPSSANFYTRSDAMLHSYPRHSSTYLLNPPENRGYPPSAAEHMLRRKTPNGTLAAGYDGRPLGWAGSPPANKHFLMPASDDGGGGDIETHARLPKAGPPNAGPSPSAFNHEHAGRIPYDRYRAIGQNMETYSSGNGMPKQVESESKPFANPGLDSVLYQSSPSHQLSHYSGERQAPMVMQPMWPPCVGITSLNSPGPYGPYWPNGAFVPYRPAPIRDPRFPSVATSLAPDAAWRNHQLSPEYSANSYQNPRTPETDIISSPTRWLPTARGRRVTDDHLFFSPPAQDPQPDLSPGEGTSNLYNNTCLDSKSAAYIDEWCPHSSRGPAGSSVRSNYIPFYGSDHLQRHGLEVNNVEFKERVLIWAHRVYLSLSRLKQQTKPAGPNVQYRNHGYLPEHASPMLPRRTFPKLSNTRDKARLPREQQAHHDKEPSNSVSPHDGGAGKTGLFSQACVDDRTPGSANHTFVGDSQYRSTNGYPATQNTQYKLGSRSLAVPQMQAQSESSPATAAATATEMLSRLCQESGWKWTDGMLLGGCLAYALGEYGRAFKWYSKVLSCDPK